MPNPRNMVKPKKNPKGTSSNGTKKGKSKGKAPRAPPKWDPKAKLLTDHEEEQRAGIFLATHEEEKFLIEKFIDRESLEPYGIIQKFEDLGWGGVLDFKPTTIHYDAVKEWMSTLVRDWDGVDYEKFQLLGMIGEREYSLTVNDIREQFSVDTGAKVFGETGVDARYVCLTQRKRYGSDLPENWESEYRDLLFLTRDEGAIFQDQDKRIELRPLPKALMSIVRANVNPRCSDKGVVRFYDLRILHALMTGSLAISFALNVLLNIWLAYDSKGRKTYPHTYIISTFLARQRDMQIPGTIYRTRIMQPTKGTFKDLVFEETPKGFFIKDVSEGMCKGHIHFIPKPEIQQVDQTIQLPLPHQPPPGYRTTSLSVGNVFDTSDLREAIQAEIKNQQLHRTRYEMEQILTGGRLDRIEQLLQTEARERMRAEREAEDRERNRIQDHGVIVEYLVRIQEQLHRIQDIGMDTYHTAASTRFHQEYYQHEAWYRSTHDDPMDIDISQHIPVSAPVVYRHPNVRDYPGPSAYQHYMPPGDEFHQEGFQNSDLNIFGYRSQHSSSPPDNY